MWVVTVAAGLALLAARGPSLTAAGIWQGLLDALGGAIGVRFILVLVHDAGQGLDLDRSRQQEEKGEVS